MELSQSIRQILSEQAERSRQLEALLDQLENADYIQENTRLRTENQRCAQQIAACAEHNAQLRAENKSLQERLAGQMYSQRDGILSASSKDADVLFGREEQACVNRLAAQNMQVRSRIAAMKSQLAEAGNVQEQQILDRLGEVEAMAKAYMREASGNINRTFAEEREKARAEYEAMRMRQITPEQMMQKQQRNSLELKIGGKVTVIVGTLFILFAVILALRYSFEVLQSNIVKGILAYLVGVLFLGVAEFVGRKRKNVFSTGLCAGGVAILFACTAISYFNLEILSIPAAILICILITALSLLQSMRYNAQLIAVFALIGGYMPMTALNDSPMMIISAMVYFLLLNLFVLLTALRKRWQPLKFFSFFASVFGAAYLFSLMDYAMGAGIAYVAANLIMYMAIVLVYPILRRVTLRASDTVLLGLCTLFSCGHLFFLLNYNGYEKLNGVVALAFCILYFVFARWLGVVLTQDSGAKGLFYATSFGFWVLVIPLQLEPELISLGWLVEGIALWVFGVLAGHKWYRRAGGAISALCLASFALNDVMVRYHYSDHIFLWKYGAITLGALIMTGVYLYKYFGDTVFWKSNAATSVIVLKCCAAANLWFYLLYATQYLFDTVLLNQWSSYLSCGLIALVTLGLGMIYRAPTLIRDNAMMVIARVICIIGLLMTFVFLSEWIPVENKGLWVIGLIMMIAFAAATIFVFYDLLRGFKASSEINGLLSALYGLVIAIELLATQADQGGRSMLISLVLIVWAFSVIVFGFVRRYSLMRRFGLALSLLSMAKLFLVDLYFLPTGQRIFSFFVFGLLFLAIAWIYQVFSRKLFAETAAINTNQHDFEGQPDPVHNPPDQIDNDMK